MPKKHLDRVVKVLDEHRLCDFEGESRQLAGRGGSGSVQFLEHQAGRGKLAGRRPLTMTSSPQTSSMPSERLGSMIQSPEGEPSSRSLRRSE